MKIIKATWLVTCDEHSTIIENGAVVYDEHIVCVAPFEAIQQKYPNNEIEDLGENSVLMPGLINTHVHLEFSANKTTLKYGNFMDWLYSVMSSREELVEKSTQALIQKELKKILKTGTTTIGAISSYGFDLQPCVNSALNVVYFNEVIGSKPEMIDTLFSDFKARLNSTLQYQSKRFIPAIAIHSPYSVHPFLVREVLKIAKEQKLCVTAHFLESSEEKEWLKNNSGSFLDFFMKLLGQKQSVASPLEFLELFNTVQPLSFTHCVEANEEELSKIAELHAVINHCPTSNRVLNNTKLNLDQLNFIPFSLGTDGLSSNNSLSMFDEMRNALMIHTYKNINGLAKKLLKAATLNGAKALGLNKGSLEAQKESDMIAFTLPDTLHNKEDLATHIILHTKYVTRTIIGGKDVGIF